MLRKGLVVTVILLFIGVAFVLPINANVSKSSLEPVSDIDVIEENNDKKEMLYQKLIEKAKELGYQEKSSDEDCGCDEGSATLKWEFPFICNLMSYFVSAIITFARIFGPRIPLIFFAIGWELGCSWA